ncbi:hypothetical protein [Paraliomyxa miuraensis]|uniref:hypothetical protein n=1 Tax=Paraliomyxa miuraensis TaxID=376150 RepID=UPI00225161E8|nr:hypothetical protein [Paraliomyxa miuraensis]MCX4246105.1 hypothetical protein [Paraliomyxa miuraensis]
MLDPSTTSGTTSTTEGTSMSTTSTTAPPTTTSMTTDPTVDPMTTGTTTVDPSETADSTTSVGTTDTDTTGPVDPCELACDGLACGPSEGCACGDCSPMATCADDQTYCGLPVGFFNDFGSTALVNGQVQLGFRFQVFEERVVRRLAVISGGAGVDVRMALYTHDGVGPADRIAQTGAVTLYANGVNEFDVGATTIMPGEYWVMLHTAGSTPLARTFNGDNGYEEAVRINIPFMDGFPMTMNDEMVITDYRYNLYMVVED